MLIRTTIGHENLPTGGTKLYVFLCPNRRFNLKSANFKEAHLWHFASKHMKLCDDGPTIPVIGSPSVHQAADGVSLTVAGKWTEMVHDIPDGTLLKVFVSRTVNGSQRVSNIYLRVREGAALNRLSISTLPSTRTHQTRGRLDIEGLFDVLDLPEAIEDGAEAPKTAHMPSFIRRRWEALPYIELVELQRASSAAPIRERVVVQSSSGEQVEIISERRPRALDL